MPDYGTTFGPAGFGTVDPRMAAILSLMMGGGGGQAPAPAAPTGGLTGMSAFGPNVQTSPTGSPITNSFLGLTPEQVNAAFSAVTQGRVAETGARGAALAEQMAPAETQYKIGQFIKAMTEAGLAGRETAVKERKQTFEEEQALPASVEAKARAEAGGKYYGEALARRKNLGEVFKGVPFPKEITTATGFTNWEDYSESGEFGKDAFAQTKAGERAVIAAEAVKEAARINNLSTEKINAMTADEINKSINVMTPLLKLMLQLNLTGEQGKMAIGTAGETVSSIVKRLEALRDKQAAQEGTSLAPKVEAPKDTYTDKAITVQGRTVPANSTYRIVDGKVMYKVGR